MDACGHEVNHHRPNSQRHRLERLEYATNNKSVYSIFRLLWLLKVDLS